MRDILFKKGTEVVVIRIDGKNLTFAKQQGQFLQFAKIEGLQLSPAGIIQEFPDLKDKPIEEMKQEAIKRFKEYINNMKTEEEIQDYLIQDLAKHGYKAFKLKRQGFRDVTLN